MNCKSFSKYIGAFADGELDVRLTLEALEHLNMCPSCVKQVAEVSDCKAALQRVWPEHRAPASLRDRVMEALGGVSCSYTQSEEPVHIGSTVSAVAVVSKTRWFSRFVKPMAVAAALGVCFTVWQYAQDRQVQPGAMTVLEARTVADVREQHMHCAAMPMGMHHDKTLTRSLPTIANRLSERLHLRVIAPDLTRFGYKLIGADACGIRGRAAAHVLYESAGGERKLSVYSVNRLADLIPNRPASPSGRRYFVTSTDNALTVLAWHDGMQSYTVCAPLPEDVLLSIFDHVDLAAAEPRPRMYDTMASHTIPTR